MGGINGTSGSVSQGRAGSMTESPLDQQSASEAGPHRQAQTPRSTTTKTLSCRECRRLKLKCSREWPCTSCVKRGIESLCPDGIMVPEKKSRSSEDPRLLDRIARLEQALDSRNRGTPDASPASDSPQGHSKGKEREQSRHPHDHTESNARGRLDQLAALATAPHRVDALAGIHNRRLEDEHFRARSVSSTRSAQDDTEMESQRGQSPGAQSEGRGHGMLAIGNDGRTRYLGPSAHSIYLTRDDEDGARPKSPIVPSTSASPWSQSHAQERRTAPLGTSDDALHSAQDELPLPDETAFGPGMVGPFWPTPGLQSPLSDLAVVNYLRPYLPPLEEAQRAVEMYYGQVAFMWDPCPRHKFEREIWSAFYGDLDHGPLEGESSSHNPTPDRPGTASRSSQVPAHPHPHKLSVLFMVLSLGVLFDTRLPPFHPSARKYYSCAWAALSLSNFTDINTLESLVSLHLMGNFLVNRMNGQHADSFYALAGLAMRIAVGMGLHRDGRAWNLPTEQLQERRLLFWELHGFDVYRSLAYCRPCTLQEQHIDVRLPYDNDSVQDLPATGESEAVNRDFHIGNWKHVQLINKMLDRCLCSSSPSYATTLQIDQMFRKLRQNTPLHLRPKLMEKCKYTEEAFAELSAEGSAYVRSTLQQHTHIGNSHQCLLLLHRSWFVRALHEGPDPFRSQFAKSVVAVSESSRALINITRSIRDKLPRLSVRFFYFWVYTFNAGVCQALHVLHAPTSVMTTSAWEDIEAACQLFQDATKEMPPGWAGEGLTILLRLKERAEASMFGSKASVAASGDEFDLVGDTRRLVPHRHAQKDGSPSGRNGWKGIDGTAEPELSEPGGMTRDQSYQSNTSAGQNIISSLEGPLPISAPQQAILAPEGLDANQPSQRGTECQPSAYPGATPSLGPSLNLNGPNAPPPGPSGPAGSAGPSWPTAAPLADGLDDAGKMIDMLARGVWDDAQTWESLLDMCGGQL